MSVASTTVRVLRTAEEVKAAIAESLIPASHWESLGIPANAHFHDLEPEQVALLSEAMQENSQVVLIELNSETLPAMLRLREAMPGEPAWCRIGGKSLVAESNATNRMLNEDRGDVLSKTMLARMFTTGPALTIDSNGNWVNGGHRLYGGVKTLAAMANYSVVIRVELGVPPQLRNLWDWKNREKKPADLLFQDPAFMPAEVYNSGLVDGEIAPLPEAVEPTQVPKLRDKLSREYVSFAGFTLMRLAGKNIHSHANDEDILRFGDRCKEAEQLLAEVYRRRLGGDGKELGQVKKFPASQIACALLLASNADHEDSVNLVVDWELVDKVMTAFAESTEAIGPFSLAISKVVAATSKQKQKLPRKGVFDTLVRSLQQFIDQGSVTENPVPSEKELKAKHFPHFGGVDIGYQEPVKE